MRHRSLDAALALVLVSAATLKAYQLWTGSGPLVAGAIHSRLAFASLIQAEVILGAWLIIGGFVRPRFIVAIACFTLFACVACYEMLRSLPSCGCFGNVKMPPAITLCADVCAVVALWFTRFHRFRSADDLRSRKVVFVAAMLTIWGSGALWIVYYSVPSSTSNELTYTDSTELVILQPSSWLNKPFDLLDNINGSVPLRRGRWFVVFYHYDCESCLKTIRSYELLRSDPVDPHIAFVAVPPRAPSGQEPVAVNSAYLRLTLRPDRNWFATTPIVVALKEGRVLAVLDGEQATQVMHVGW